MNELDFNKYKDFFDEVIRRINSAKVEAYKTVNYHHNISELCFWENDY